MRKTRLIDVHCRLFSDDIEAIKAAAAEKRIPWQVELRLRVHQSCTPKQIPGVKLLRP